MTKVLDKAPADEALIRVLASLEATASLRTREEMVSRYGINVDRAFGVSMAAMQRIAKPLAPDHGLAGKLWTTGWYEARMIACMIDDPALVSLDQMDSWRADFDNWAIVDLACFRLFDRVPGAPSMIRKWIQLNDEFGRRAGFALLACLALHGRGERSDFLEGLELIESAAADDRNFVRKGSNWALRAIGGKGDEVLRSAAREVADRLARSEDKTARWNGKAALRAFRKADAGRSG